MATFTIAPVDNDLYSDVVGGGTPAGGDAIEITKGYNEYTTGLTFTANNWGNVIVGQGFQGEIGANGSPWTLQANTASTKTQLLGGRKIYISPGASTIARLVIDMADPSAMVVVSGGGGTLTDLYCNAGNVELLDSITAFANLYVGRGGRPKVRGSSGAAAMTAIFIRPGGQADLERDVAAITVDGDGVARVGNDRVSPSGTVTVSGRLEVREMGAIGTGLVLNEGAVLDLSRAKTTLSTVDLTLGDHCRVIERFGGPSYSASGTTTTRGRGALVEKVTR